MTVNIAPATTQLVAPERTRLAARLLYTCARLMYRTEFGHSDKLKTALKDQQAASQYA